MTILANFFFASLYAAQAAAMMTGIVAVCVGEWITTKGGRGNSTTGATGSANTTRRA